MNHLFGHTSEDEKEFDNGERCYLCYQSLNEAYGQMTLCTECGGKGELIDYNLI